MHEHDEPTSDAGHDRWVARLSEHLDGALDASAAEAMERHLDRCPDCAHLAEELREVRDHARALRPVAPPRDLWPAIRTRLNEAEVVTFPGSPEPPVHARRTVRFTVPQLAAAALALMLGTGIAGWALGGAAAPDDIALPASDPSVSFAEAMEAGDVDGDLGDDLRALELMLREGRDRLDPNIRRLVESNLAVIERAISESRAALEVDPGNGYLEQHLNGVLERKRAYLRQAADFVSQADD